MDYIDLRGDDNTTDIREINNPVTVLGGYTVDQAYKLIFVAIGTLIVSALLMGNYGLIIWIAAMFSLIAMPSLFKSIRENGMFRNSKYDYIEDDNYFLEI